MVEQPDDYVGILCSDFICTPHGDVVKLLSLPCCINCLNAYKRIVCS